MRVLIARAAITAGSLVAIASEASCAPTSPPWTVVAVRERRPGEVSFEDATGYLFPSPDLNHAPGPDSLVAHVRIEDHRPHLELQDLRTGEATPLIEGNASLPNWSPDGKYIICVLWKSAVEHHELVVVELASRQVVIDPPIRAAGSWSKWSPDGGTLAASGGIYGRPMQLLYTVAVPTGEVTALDTLNVVADYEFSWSPDGRWLAFTRPIALDHMGEDPVASDIWIAEPASGGTWPLLETPEWIEVNPRWITNRTILVDRISWNGSEPGIQQTIVLELRRSEQPERE